MSDFAVLGNTPRFLLDGITLVKISLRQYYAHCAFLFRLYRAYYTIKPINMRSKYDQGVPVAFVIRLGRPPYASDTLMALCSIKAPFIPSFIYWLTDVMDLRTWPCCSNPDCRPPRRLPIGLHTRDRGSREKKTAGDLKDSRSELG